jgi:TPR repeat protein
MLLEGNGVTRDPAAALGWFSRAAATGHLMALNMVGRCHDLGWGTAIDKARAAECYHAAAARGLDWAMYNYATLLALGDGVREDKAASLAWLRRAAALGNAKAINFVGSFHEDGWSTPVDMAAARRCYAEAAQGGDFRGQFNHARMLIVDGRIDEACVWLKQVRETATGAFIKQMNNWLSQHPRADVRDILIGNSA